MSELEYKEVQPASPTNIEEYHHAIEIPVEAGSLTEFQSLLQQWRSDTSVPDPTSQDLQYIISRAVEKDGRPEILEYFLCQGGEVDAYTIGQTTSPQIFEIFMKHGWKVDNATLISHISQPDLVSLFLAHGADPNTPSAYGVHPLDIAALRAPLESVKRLHSPGASVGPGSRALNVAAQGEVPDRISIMEYLLEHGADINGIAEDFPGPSEARESGRKGTPLHAAAKWGNEVAKEWLLKHGADPEVKNELGLTPEEWGKRLKKMVQRES